MNILLFSGGLDSTLLLHKLKHVINLCVSFRYGQRHAIELGYAESIADRYSVKQVEVDLGTLPLVDEVNIAGRNAIFLTRAAAICQEHGGGVLIIGCNYSDADRFSDCRPSFIRSMSEALSQAYGVSVLAPLLKRTKKQIVMEALELGLPPTWTCYQPQADASPCGECYACKGLKL